jgi:hypothetical protein
MIRKSKVVGNSVMGCCVSGSWVPLRVIFLKVYDMSLFYFIVFNETLTGVIIMHVTPAYGDNDYFHIDLSKCRLSFIQ